MTQIEEIKSEYAALAREITAIQAAQKVNISFLKETFIVSLLIMFIWCNLM